MTSDNVPVDFNAYAVLQIKRWKTPALHKDFGKFVYENKIQEEFRTYVRNYAKKQPLFKLTSDAETLLNGQEQIKEKLSKYLNDEQIQMDCLDVIIGKVAPPDDVLEETSKTAAQKQRRKTEDERALTELSRKKAEVNKAIADQAYMKEFGMTVNQYLKLRDLEIEKEKIDMVRNKQNVHIVMNSGGGQTLSTFKVQ